MTERRRDTRQPLQREVRYRVRGARAQSGSGTTLNISSHALAFQAKAPLPIGSRLDISVSWPAEAGSILRLTAHGVVVRSDGRITVCTMEGAAFRAEELDESEPRLSGSGPCTATLHSPLSGHALSGW